MKIIENAVPQKLFELVVSKVCNFNVIPFYFSENTAAVITETNNPSPLYNGSNHSGWSHPCFDGNRGGIMSPTYDLVIAAIFTAFDNCGEELYELYRIRIGLITAQSTSFPHMPHIDLGFPHKNALIYLNDSDGDTLLYEEKYNYNQHLNPHQYFIENYNDKEMNVIYRSTPKANKMFLFDGAHYHSSSTPINTSSRVVININYI